MAAIARAVPSLPEGERFFLLAGQPAHVRDQWDWAMGLRDFPPVTDSPTALVEVR